MTTSARQLAIVTGASSGIGYELARLCIDNGFDVIIAADEPEIIDAADRLAKPGIMVTPVQCDLSTPEGVETLYGASRGAGRPVDALLANAGTGLGHAFLDQDLTAALRVVHTNINSTISLIHKVGRDMRARRAGRILITGSIAGLIPGAFMAVYNGSKAFLDSFAVAISNELQDSGVTVTNLMPGATDTAFFDRAGMRDTQLGRDDGKDKPADVAKTGFEAMMKGELAVVHGLKNKIQAAVSHVTPDKVLANRHREMAAPSATKQ